jgi:hypothetical protein
MAFIEPIVKERFAKMDELGETWEDAPVRDPDFVYVSVVHEVHEQNDMLMWLMKEAKGVERSLEGLARRLLLLNFASIHSTSLVRGCLLNLQKSLNRLLIIHGTDIHASTVPSSREP